MVDNTGYANYYPSYVYNPPALVDQYSRPVKIVTSYPVMDYYNVPYGGDGVLFTQNVPLEQMPRQGNEVYYRSKLCYTKNICPTNSMFYDYNNRGNKK